MNGYTQEDAHQQAQPTRPLTPSSHLGKRKRSLSPTKPTVNGNIVHNSADPKIEDVVREIKR